jgi:hypothetical protein
VDIARAILIGALPVAIFTFVSLQWLIASGRLEKFTDREDLKRQVKTQAKAVKQARRAGSAFDPRVFFHKDAPADFLHNKTLSFGGGFYGTMALLTYILIELIEIWDFLRGMVNPETWISKLGIELLIDFVVNSLTNLIAAFVWFATLPDMIAMDNGLLWLGASYGGYLAGLTITTRWGDRIWAHLVQLIKSPGAGR